MKPGLCLVLLLVAAGPAWAHGGSAELELSGFRSAFAPRADGGPATLQSHTRYSFDLANQGAQEATGVVAKVTFGARGFAFQQALADLPAGATRHVELDFQGAPHPYACLEVHSDRYHAEAVCGLVGDVVLP